jgi:hypothetical protein
MTAEPSCRDDSRFLDDGRAESGNADLAPICAACPVLAQCVTYARSASRDSITGYWAGKRRGTHHHYRDN